MTSGLQCHSSPVQIVKLAIYSAILHYHEVCAFPSSKGYTVQLNPWESALYPPFLVVVEANPESLPSFIEGVWTVTAWVVFSSWATCHLDEMCCNLRWWRWCYGLRFSFDIGVGYGSYAWDECVSRFSISNCLFGSGIPSSHPVGLLSWGCRWFCSIETFDHKKSRWSETTFHPLLIIRYTTQAIFPWNDVISTVHFTFHRAIKLGPLPTFDQQN